MENTQFLKNTNLYKVTLNYFFLIKMSNAEYINWIFLEKICLYLVLSYNRTMTINIGFYYVS